MNGRNVVGIEAERISCGKLGIIHGTVENRR